MNRTEAIEALREALSSDKQLAIAVHVLGLTRAIHGVAPPTGKAVASINPDAVLQSAECDLDGEPARISATGLTVERARIVALFQSAAAAYAVSAGLEVEVRILADNEEPLEKDVAYAVEIFGRGNGADVDLSDYQPLRESLETVPQEDDDSDEIDGQDALGVTP